MAYQDGEKDKAAFQKKIDTIERNIVGLPCTVVDWGSAEGAYSFAIAQRSFARNVISVESNGQPTYDKKKPTEFQKERIQQAHYENINVFETRIRPEDIMTMASRHNYRPLIDYQLLLNILHHFNMERIDWYKFVYSFLTLAGTSFICIPVKAEANNKKTVNNQRIAEWYGKNTTPEQLIKDIITFNGDDEPEVHQLGWHHSYYADLDRPIMKVELEPYRVPNREFPREFVTMLSRSEREWLRVQTEGG